MSATIDYAYNAFCDGRFPLPSEAQVAALERVIGVRFPDDFRAYVLEYNGGLFNEPSIVPPSNGCPLDRLTFMNGIGATEGVAELARDGDIAMFDDNDPPQLVPIGATMMGNLILLVTDPDGRGSIGLSQAWSKRTFFLADGIEDFFALLAAPLDE